MNLYNYLQGCFSVQRKLQGNLYLIFLHGLSWPSAEVKSPLNELQTDGFSQLIVLHSLFHIETIGL